MQTEKHVVGSSRVALVATRNFVVSEELYAIHEETELASSVQLVRE